MYNEKSSLKILLYSFYSLNNYFDYLSLFMWTISNLYFVVLTIYELYNQVLRNIFLKKLVKNKKFLESYLGKIYR